MERLDFIRKLFMLYGKSADKNIDLIKDYDLILSEEQNIDWAKMLRLVEKSDINSLPSPKYLKSLFPKCKIEVAGQYRYDDGNIVYVLRDDARKKRTGHHLFYTVPLWHETRTIGEIEKVYRNKYGDRLLSFKYYPENFEIIGNKIYKTIISREMFNDDYEHLILCEEL